MTKNKNRNTGERKSQQGNGGEGDLNQRRGGYVAVVHHIEEETYGPDCPFPDYVKVFNYIKHRLLRDWQYVKAISRNEIAEATGIPNKHLSRAFEILEKQEMILAHRSRTGKVWNETQYALHPKRFTKNTLWHEAEDQIQKGLEKSTHSIGEDDKIIPITRKKQTHKREYPPLPQTGAPLLPEVGVPNDPNIAELMKKWLPKNPSLKEPSLKKEKEIDFFVQEAREPKDRKLQAQWLKETEGEISFDEWKRKQA